MASPNSMMLTIAQADQNLMSANASISFYTMVTQMEDAIINGYDGTPFQDYISNWTVAIVRHFQSKTVDLSKSKKADWIKVASGIILLASKCDFSFQPCKLSAPVESSVGQLAAVTNNVSATSVVSPSSRSCRSLVAGSSTVVSASELSASEPSADVDSPSVKVPKLSQNDLINIRERFENLDRTKMWQLSTGTIVEDVMKDVALTFEYEHPSHSLILYVTDHCWFNVFDPDELAEIRGYRAVEMPAVSLEVESYFQQLHNLDSQSVYTKVHSGLYPIDSDLNWIQKSYLDTFRLSKSDFFLSKTQTEGNIMKRLWANLDSCYDFSFINCVSGEKCSQASADASNNDRCASAFGRQASGRKMDYLFSTIDYEVGCGECGLVSGNNTTKELVDAKYKMPKVMRDMANCVFKTHVGLCHYLCIAGYYIGGDTLQLLTLDFPVGYVARLNGFGPVRYPKTIEQTELLPRVLKLILSGRVLMENAKVKIDSCREFAPVGRVYDVNDDIVPTFAHVPPAGKTRKRKSSMNISTMNIKK